MLTERSTAKGPRFEQFAATRLFQIFPWQALSLSSDGRQVAYSINTTGQFNLWVQPLEGGNARQLTLFTDNTVRNVAWSPDGTTLAFIADHDGDEFHQLYTIPAKGGWPDQLTNTPDAQFILGSWSPDGTRLAYASNDRNRAEIDIVVRDMASGEELRLLTGGRFSAGDWSPDGQALLAFQSISNTNSNLYIVSPGAEPQLLTPHEGEANYFPVGWAENGKAVYLITDQGREFKGLARYDMDSRKWEYIEQPQWDIEGAAISRDGRRLVWTVNEDGYSVFHARDLSSDEPLPLPPLPKGVTGKLNISANGQRLAFLLARPTHPWEVFVLDLEAGTARQLTDSFMGGLAEEEMVEPEVVRFTSFDGKQIPAWLYKPKEINGKIPVLLSIHGGPEMQERPDGGFTFFPGMYQYLLSRGIAILATNIRGSTGYGKSYQKLIQRDWGGGDLKDIEAAAHYLHSLDWVDPARIGVFGISYGGFATLSAVSRLPDLWRVAVEWFGPANLITLVQSVPPSWRPRMEAWVGDAEKDREMLQKGSPMTYVKQIQTPLLIVQGSKDPRVVKAESDQIVERLQALGRTVSYDVYQDEGHLFVRRENLVKALKDTVEWLERYLLSQD